MLRTTRGQPLVALIGVLGGWVAMRTIMLDASEVLPVPVPLPVPVQVVALAPQRAAPAVLPGSAALPPRRADMPGEGGATGLRFGPPVPLRARADSMPPRLHPVPALPLPRLAAQLPPVKEVHAAATHHLMWLAAMARLPLPEGMMLPAVTAQGGPAGFRLAASTPLRTQRWSGDGWLLLRGGGRGTPVGAAPLASYGASQVGAVLRYRLAPGSAHRPTAYLRAAGALTRTREQHAAIGLSVRPLSGLPVIVAGELRAARRAGGTRLEPAVMAVSELAPLRLPLGASAEAYVQAGYVGGRDPTGFVDGQLRVGKSLARVGQGELRLGAGVWGGAQKGASRLDVGPAADMGVPLGGSAAARLGVDWRFRVAGSAAPQSGPALTLSAGF